MLGKALWEPIFLLELIAVGVDAVRDVAGNLVGAVVSVGQANF